MGLIKITSDMTDSERTAVLNANLQYLQLSTRLRKYPIGMIVAFDTDIDPNELYGGTWERIEGRFIWGVEDGETAGATGGEKTHELTVGEIPAHVHIENNLAMIWNTASGNVGADPSRKEMVAAGAVTPSVATSSVGGGQSHNNMPPYYGAYIWRKTAHGIGEDPTLTEYEAMMKQMNDALSETKTLCNLLFSNALRGSASGEAVRLTDVSPLEHTLTVKLKSKNLLPFPYFHSSMTNQVGIAYTVNSDGTITANGTATGRSEFVLSANKSDWASGNYVLSGCPSGGSADTYFLQTINGFSDTGSGLKVNNTAELKRISIIIKKGTTVSNLVFKPQLELGTTPTAYTPYITDFSGVTLKRYGKNLLPYPYKNTNIDYTFNGINYKVKSDGTVVLNGTANEQSYFILAGLVLNKGVYYLSGCPSGGQGSTYSIYFQYDNFSYYKADYGSGVKIDINEKKNCAVAITIGKNTAVSNLIFKPMLEVGSKLTDFEERRTAVAYTPAVDGTVTGVTSISPDMTFLSDTDGIIINAEYNKDLNKAFAELQQAIISLGGNV